MNTKEYIESGILEAYILGVLSLEEQAEVAANIAMYPELATEVAAIEKAMQQFAESNAVEPPIQMQEQIWSAINKDTPAAQPAMPLPATQPVANKTIDIARPAKGYDSQWQRAAVWVALIGSVVANVMLWNQKDHAEQQVASIQTRMDTMQVQQQQKLTALAASYQKVKDMMTDTSMQTIVMHTVIKDKPMAATIYWGKQKGDTYLMVDNMPMPPQGMQYQMWVIKDGKPVDMGVIPNDYIASADVMNKFAMQVTNGQAFAISLEKAGGNPTPTQVCVLGKVASI